MKSDCFDSGEKPRVVSLQSLIRLLTREGAKHRSLYHYTRWDAFAKMMQPVMQGVCEGHRMMLLSPADKMNDKVEKGWGKNVFMTCFSYSKYEDVAMWMNYGKRSPDAVRVRIDGDAVAAWFRDHRKNKREIFAAEEDGRGGFIYEPLSPDRIASIELADVAYVIHGKLMTGRHWGNIEYGRRFYRVEDEAGGFNWSDDIYDGDPGKDNPDLPAFFKKRGWGYERETRLVITLKEGAKVPRRLAVIFDGPFQTLSAVSSGMSPPPDCCCEETDEIRTHHSIMRGPWFHKDSATNVAAGKMHLSDVKHGSDYASEIEIISTNRMGIRELVVQAEKRLREIEDRQRRDTLTSDDKRFLRALGGDLRSAAKTINYHIDHRDYKPNTYKLSRLEIIDPRRLAELSLIDKTAYSYLEALREIAASSKAEWKHRISHVRKYGM